MMILGRFLAWNGHEIEGRADSFIIHVNSFGGVEHPDRHDRSNNSGAIECEQEMPV